MKFLILAVAMASCQAARPIDWDNNSKTFKVDTSSSVEEVSAETCCSDLQDILTDDPVETEEDDDPPMSATITWPATEDAVYPIEVHHFTSDWTPYQSCCNCERIKTIVIEHGEKQDGGLVVFSLLLLMVVVCVIALLRTLPYIKKTHTRDP